MPKCQAKSLSIWHSTSVTIHLAYRILYGAQPHLDGWRSSASHRRDHINEVKHYLKFIFIIPAFLWCFIQPKKKIIHAIIGKKLVRLAVLFNYAIWQFFLWEQVQKVPAQKKVIQLQNNIAVFFCVCCVTSL